MALNGAALYEIQKMYLLLPFHWAGFGIDVCRMQWTGAWLPINVPAGSPSRIPFLAADYSSNQTWTSHQHHHPLHQHNNDHHDHHDNHDNHENHVNQDNHDNHDNHENHVNQDNNQDNNHDNNNNSQTEPAKYNSPNSHNHLQNLDIQA